MTTTPDTTELVADTLLTAPTFGIDAELVREAVTNGLAAGSPVELGDRGRVFLVPPGFTLHDRDVTVFEDLPRHRTGQFRFVGVRSLATYVNRYRTADTLGYIADVYGIGTKALTADLDAARYVLDDLPPDATARRGHTAHLILRPTTPARRWGTALAAGSLSQEQLLDLVVDGIGEIATPDGATLRDLIADLHAIRTTSARSVIRTGGGTAVEVADNVALHAGTGNTVEVPPSITITFSPFAGVPGQLVLDVKVKPTVRDEKVTFTLQAPGLDDGLARILGEVAADLTAQTTIEPLWTP